MDRLLEGRVAVVTGGGKGIGGGISRALAAQGAKVVFNYNSNPDFAERTVDEIKQNGGEAYTCLVNVQNREQVDAMMQKAAELYGGIDILVNNAAWQPNMDIDECTEEVYDGVIDINLGGYFRCIQSALPYLKKSEHPRVINISSIHGKRPTDFDVCYSMSKGGIEMLTREAAMELIQYGIRVNALLPGGTKIEFKSGKTQPFKFKRIERERQYGFRGVGTPEDVANAVIFLASEKGSHINGTSIRLDRGAILF
ncbi:MAG: SDR family oxidoreductase [Clostridiales bacterium]|nr:SDR family oxidoreductase [Clostridiales bacterium]